MDNPIIITPSEIISAILAFCGAIITISAATTIIFKVVERFRQPNKKQDERIDALEQEVRDIKARLHDGDNQFTSDNKRMEEIEDTIRKTNKIIIEGLQALTAHAINGDNIENLKTVKNRLDEYLLNKI